MKTFYKSRYHKFFLKIKIRIGKYFLKELVTTWFAVTLILLIILSTNKFTDVIGDIASGDLPSSSLFQIIFVTAFATVMHATTNYTVDMALAVLLLIGGVLGAQIGTRIGLRLKAEQLRILLSLIVMLVCLKIAGDLVLEPKELFSLDMGITH